MDLDIADKLEGPYIIHPFPMTENNRLLMMDTLLYGEIEFACLLPIIMA